MAGALPRRGHACIDSPCAFLREEGDIVVLVFFATKGVDGAIKLNVAHFSVGIGWRYEQRL